MLSAINGQSSTQLPACQKPIPEIVAISWKEYNFTNAAEKPLNFGDETGLWQRKIAEELVGKARFTVVIRREEPVG